MLYSGGHEYFLFKTRKKQSHNEKWQTAVTQTKAKKHVSFLFR